MTGEEAAQTPQFVSGTTDLMKAVALGENSKLPSLLYLARQKDSNGRTALMYSVQAGNTHAFDILLSKE